MNIYGGGAFIGVPQNTSRPVGREDLEAFKARIEEMLKNKKCADFIRELLEEAKRQTEQPYSDILTTFDQVKFYWAPGQSRAFYYPVAAANISNTIITEKPSGSLANQKDRREYLISQTTLSFLNETLHHVGKGATYRDGVLANAMNAILVKKNLGTPQLFSDATGIDVQNASIYWHPKVWAACPAPKR